jgi:hypothetical protein
MINSNYLLASVVKVQLEYKYKKKDTMSLSTVDLCNECFPDEQFKLFIGIDFGTDGTAITLLHADAKQLYVHNLWLETNDNSIKPKSAILINNHEELISFGQAAMSTYLTCSEELRNKWMLFEHFKMSLHSLHTKNNL